MFRRQQNQHRSAKLCWLLVMAYAGFPVSSWAQTGSTAPVAADDAARLTAETNLVQVRVVVRDGHGQPVAGLKKDDFRLLDRGKEQSISHFEEEPGDVAASTQSSPSSVSSAAAAPGAAPTALNAAASREIALFFDDLNAPQSSMMQARDAAARFLSGSLTPSDRVAIFTSRRLLTDFTADQAKIKDALTHLSGGAKTRRESRQCPDLSEFQAEELLRSKDYLHDRAWQLAGAEIKQCEGGNTDPKAPLEARQILTINAMARKLLDEAGARASANLDQLEKVTEYFTHLPGQKTIVLVSPGFLSEAEQNQLDRIIERALRAQVLINALDPKGLTVMMRELDASRAPISVSDQSARVAAYHLDQGQNFQEADVLAELAQGTGGRFFHDNNDLATGFAGLVGHVDDYLLSFAPRDLKLDDQFHELKVTLIEKQKGFTVTARRGYFAAKRTDEPPVMSAANQPGALAVAPAHSGDQIVPVNKQSPSAQTTGPAMDIHMREALLSTTNSTQIPIGIEVTPIAREGESGGLTLSIHLDVRALTFRKDGDHSLNTVTFAGAVFDQNDKALMIKQRAAKLNVTDDQLKSLLADGLTTTLSFSLPAGAYRVRAVVMESQQQQVGSISKSVSVP